MNRLKIKIRNISSNPLPKYATSQSAGVDIQAYLPQSIFLHPMERNAIPTGIYIELPDGYEAQIRSRSGLAFLKGVICANSPGTIDTDFRGEIKVLLINLSREVYEIKCGDRIGQMLIQKYQRIEWHEIKKLQESLRSEKGFGSTGV